MNFDFETMVQVLAVLIGSGGMVAFLKARSDIRNANKSADITNLVNTISALQLSYKELQDRYQEAIKECDQRNDRLAERVELLEQEYLQQEREKLNLRERVQQLETDLKKANSKIEELYSDLKIKEQQIQELKQENVQLRKVEGCRVGLEKL